MKPLIWGILLVTTLQAHAAPSAIDLAKEATRLEQLADQEADPSKKQELRKQACDTWNAAHEAGKRFEYYLSIASCRLKLRDLDAAETAFRSFLVEAPPDHKNRALAEQALEKVVAQRQAEQQQNSPPALTLNGPIPMEESPKQWKRRAIFAGSTLAGLGLIGSAITFGVLRAQDNANNITIGEGGTAQVIP
jgi:hypothetical protein